MFITRSVNTAGSHGLITLFLNRTGDSNVEDSAIFFPVCQKPIVKVRCWRKGIISNPPDFYFVGWKHGFTDYPRCSVAVSQRSDSLHRPMHVGLPYKQ